MGILAPFAARGINLSRLESRPGGEPWRCRFLIELDVLGTFPRWTGA